jgi:hypothetical protein
MNVLTQEMNPALAIDPTNPQRLLYATQLQDGRQLFSCPNDPTSQCNYGGLWISVDGAASWQHVDLPACHLVVTLELDTKV